MNSTSTMALSSLLPKTAPHLLSLTNPFSSSPSTLILPFRFHFLSHLPPLSPLKAASSGGDSLRSKPLTSQGRGILEEHGNHAFEEDDDDKWIDWEDQILEDTVPLVGFVRMILHSGQYVSIIKSFPLLYFTLLCTYMYYAIAVETTNISVSLTRIQCRSYTNSLSLPFECFNLSISQ